MYGNQWGSVAVVSGIPWFYGECDFIIRTFDFIACWDAVHITCISPSKLDCLFSVPAHIHLRGHPQFFIIHYRVPMLKAAIFYHISGSWRFRFSKWTANKRVPKIAFHCFLYCVHVLYLLCSWPLSYYTSSRFFKLIRKWEEVAMNNENEIRILTWLVELIQVLSSLVPRPSTT